MKTILVKRLENTLSLTSSLADNLTEASLECRMGELKSNSIGSQFWCLVGARESYAKAFAASQWVGFSCSLTKPETKEPNSVQSGLSRSQSEILEVIKDSDFSDSRIEILIDLMEHEAQHQGQLIRYFYANNIEFPKAFASRFVLAQPKSAVNKQ